MILSRNYIFHVVIKKYIGFVVKIQNVNVPISGLSKIINRTSNNNGCPYCSGHKHCDCTSFAALCPELLLEWDYEKNGDPNLYSSSSHKDVSWICKINPCGCHKWTASINSRNRKNRPISSNDGECPYCASYKLCDHNNLLALHPDVCKEWDYAKNDKPPSEYARASHDKVWWICIKGHSSKAAISGRTCKESRGCRYCRTYQYSKGQIKWLNAFSSYYNIKLQTAISYQGEYSVLIDNILHKLDGFALVNGKKIALEYDGCYWHGCKDCFNPGDINPHLNKTYAGLRRKTLIKKLKLLELGFMMISVRECDYKKNPNYYGICTCIDETTVLAFDLY
jgi:G:T-mismatch repair DNA endonuclease (very short patch repair protein)